MKIISTLEDSTLSMVGHPRGHGRFGVLAVSVIRIRALVEVLQEV